MEVKSQQRKPVLVVGHNDHKAEIDRISGWFAESELAAISAPKADNAMRLITTLQPSVVVLVGIVDWDGDGDRLVKQINALPGSIPTAYISLDGNLHSNTRPASGDEKYMLAEQGYYCDMLRTIEGGRENFLKMMRLLLQ